MDDLLTTRQLQDLLQVDRITIYRMLNDGRLRGFKVGGQWRFSRQEIERWLQEQRATLEIHEEPPATNGPLVPSAQTLPLHCIRAMQAVYAEALEVAAVTVDLDGTPLTGVNNPCGFCSLILSSAEGRRRCAQAWILANDGAYHTYHAGLACISAKIVVDSQWVAVTASCQFLNQPTGRLESWNPDLPSLAADLGLAESELETAAAGIRHVPEHTWQRIPRLLQQVADTFSEIGQERLHLLNRLQRIAEISHI